MEGKTKKLVKIRERAKNHTYLKNKPIIILTRFHRIQTNLEQGMIQFGIQQH